jgi:hypothetical protein
MPGDTNVVALLFVDHASGMSQEKGWTTDAAICKNGVNADTDRERLVAPYVSQRTPVAGRNGTVLAYYFVSFSETISFRSTRVLSSLFASLASAQRYGVMGLHAVRSSLF